MVDERRVHFAAFHEQLSDVIVTDSYARGRSAADVALQSTIVEGQGGVVLLAVLVDTTQRGVVHGHAIVVAQLLVQHDGAAEEDLGLVAVIEVFIDVAEVVVKEGAHAFALGRVGAREGLHTVQRIVESVGSLEEGAHASIARGCRVLQRSLEDRVGRVMQRLDPRLHHLRRLGKPLLVLQRHRGRPTSHGYRHTVARSTRLVKGHTERIGRGPATRIEQRLERVTPCRPFRGRRFLPTLSAALAARGHGTHDQAP